MSMLRSVERPARTNRLGRRSDGLQLNRTVMLVQEDHLPARQALRRRARQALA